LWPGRGPVEQLLRLSRRTTRTVGGSLRWLVRQHQSEQRHAGGFLPRPARAERMGGIRAGPGFVCDRQPGRVDRNLQIESARTRKVLWISFRLPRLTGGIRPAQGLSIAGGMVATGAF